MHILHISDFYHPYIGGVEQHVRTLAATLAQRGHQVSVATLWHDGLAEKELDGPVRIYRLRGTTQRATGQFAAAHRQWAPPFPDPEITLALREVLKHEQPDIVHGHDWLARSYLPLKGTSRARFVVSLHYYTRSCAKKNLMYLNEMPCTGPALNKCIRCTSAHYGTVRGPLITVSNGFWSRVERLAADKFIAVSHATMRGNGIPSESAECEIIPNFVGDNDDGQTDLSAYTTQLPKEPFFLFVGDLRPIKGLSVLLEAYSGLVGAPPLVLIGKVWSETPTDLPPNTTVLKDWPNVAVLAAWERSYAGIAPSLWQEPFGIVIIEALSRARPVIGSRIGGIPDIIEDGVSGLLVSPGNAQELRAAMQRLIDDGPLYEQLRYGAQIRAQDFQAYRVVPRIERVYAQLLPDNRSSQIQERWSNEVQ